MKTKAIVMLMLLVLVAATLVQGEPEPSYILDCRTNGGRCVTGYCSNTLPYSCGGGAICCRHAYG
uniref:Defensin 2 n=1 Tax=Panulirus japonicus TaxID=6736 RepID=B9UZC9_PANJA|nr:defensin 2 [Panulirus japonicus]